MLGLWKTYRSRRAVVGQIKPLIEGTRRRLGSIPDTAWRDPYVIGFLGMLITFVARRRASTLNTDDLAAVQARAWLELTGMSGDVLGEDICFLSASKDNRFMLGCRNAASFIHAVDVADDQNAYRLDTGPAAAFDDAQARAVLWSGYFDAYLGEQPAAPGL